jgi:hypothetical protein
MSNFNKQPQGVWLYLCCDIPAVFNGAYAIKCARFRALTLWLA